MSKRPAATVRVTKDVRPRRPKVDRADEVEQLVRQMFKSNVDIWCKKANADVDKEVKGNVVDNLTASFTSAIESIVDAATDSYLSTGFDEDDADAVECPECQHEFELSEETTVGKDGDKAKCPQCKHTFELPDEVECPECKHTFEVPLDDDGDPVESGDDVECPECKVTFELPEAS